MESLPTKVLSIMKPQQKKPIFYEDGLFLCTLDEIHGIVYHGLITKPNVQEGVLYCLMIKRLYHHF
jgi:hypothetical protein